MPSKAIPFPAPEPLLLLAQVRQRFSQKDLAPRLRVAAKTIARWERKETECPLFIMPALREILQEGQRPAGPSSFSFIDLFAGIGGVRKGFEQSRGRCVFTSEWNDWAQKTYRANFNAAVLGTAEAQRSLGILQKKYAPREQELQVLERQACRTGQRRSELHLALNQNSLDCASETRL